MFGRELDLMKSVSYDKIQMQGVEMQMAKKKAGTS